MKSVITFAVAVTAMIAMTAPANAQTCDGEGSSIDLCGFVWNDLNNNGIQDDDPDLSDGDQTGLHEVTVSLFVWDSMTSQWVDTNVETVTDHGVYAFFELPDGQYKVVVDGPDGAVPTQLHQGSDNTLDSDGGNDPDGASAVVTLGGTTGVTSQEFDFGFVSSTASNPGTGTPGYWKNHPDAWNVPAIGGSVWVGGVQYTWATASVLMGKVSKDKTVSLFAALLAAKLNVLIDNESSCISAEIAAADAWLVSHPVGSGVAASSTAWQEIADEHKKLDEYNNGLLCAPHRN